MSPRLTILSFYTFLFFLAGCKKDTSSISSLVSKNQAKNIIRNTTSSGINVFLSVDNPKENEIIYSGTNSKVLAFSIQNNTDRDSSFDGLVIAFHGAISNIKYVRLYNSEYIQIGHIVPIGDTAFFSSTSIGENKLKKGEIENYSIRIDLADNSMGTISADLVSYLSINNGNEISVGLVGNTQIISDGAGIVNIIPGIHKINVTLSAGVQLIFYDSVQIAQNGKLVSMTLHPSSGTITKTDIDSIFLFYDNHIIARGEWHRRVDPTLGEQIVIQFFLKTPFLFDTGWHKLKVVGIIRSGNGKQFSLSINDGDFIFLDEQGKAMKINGLPSSSPFYRIKL